MRLHVMRHGPAEDHAATGRDADRILSAEGRARVRRVGEELSRSRAGAPPPRVLASPLARARQTAEIMAALLGADWETADELALDAGLPLSLVAEVAGAREPRADALLIGHAPNVEHLVHALVTGIGHRPPPAIAGGFCTAMVVTLAPLEPLEPLAGAGRWQVLDVLDPRRFQ